MWRMLPRAGRQSDWSRPGILDRLERNMIAMKITPNVNPVLGDEDDQSSYVDSLTKAGAEGVLAVTREILAERGHAR